MPWKLGSYDDSQGAFNLDHPWKFSFVDIGNMITSPLCKFVHRRLSTTGLTQIASPRKRLRGLRILRAFRCSTVPSNCEGESPEVVTTWVRDTTVRRDSRAWELARTGTVCTEGVADVAALEEMFFLDLLLIVRCDAA